MMVSEPRTLLYRASRPKAEGGRVLLTIDDYHAMIAAGILGEDDKVELIAGALYEKMPSNPPHATAIYKGASYLRNRIDQATLLLFQERPIRIDAGSELEPDIAIVKMRDDFYASSHPDAEDCVLLVEVSDDSLKKDRELKLPRYAAAGIAEYWIVNLRQRQLERYTSPEPAQSEIDLPARYGEIKVFAAGSVLSHPMLGELSVATFLPAAAE